MNRNEIKVGDRVSSKSYGVFTCIEEKKKTGHCVIRFDTGYTNEVLTSDAIKGKVKDPLYPSVSGVGFIGSGEYISHLSLNKPTSEYTAWLNMLKRCYYASDGNRLKGCRSYDNVLVCEQWLNFQEFAAWYSPRREVFDKHGIIRPALDKDILMVSGKQKVYSADTCCLVPVEINCAVIGIENNQTGILKQNAGYYTRFRGKRIPGVFETIEETIAVRKAVKQDYLISLATKYQEVIEPRVYDKLCSWFEVDLKSHLPNVYLEHHLLQCLKVESTTDSLPPLHKYKQVFVH